MHLSEKQRAASIRTLAALMAVTSLLVVTLRQGPDADGRAFYHVSADEIVDLAIKESLQVAVVEDTPDRLGGRAGVFWVTLVFRKV